MRILFSVDLQLFDEIIIALGYNTQKSSRYFEINMMIEHIESAFEKYPNIKVVKFSELTAEFARKNGARFLLRGLRNTTDFEYENSISQVNRQLLSGVGICFSYYYAKVGVDKLVDCQGGASIRWRCIWIATL